MHKSC